MGKRIVLILMACAKLHSSPFAEVNKDNAIVFIIDAWETFWDKSWMEYGL